MKSFLIFLAVVAIIAALTNPDQEKHQKVLKMKLNATFQKSLDMENDNEWEQAGQAFGAMLAGVFIDKIIDNLVDSNNYLLFSTTTITWQGESKVIGIGAFGNVFLTGELDNALEEGILEQ